MVKPSKLLKKNWSIQSWRLQYMQSFEKIVFSVARAPNDPNDPISKWPTNVSSVISKTPFQFDVTPDGNISCYL